MLCARCWRDSSEPETSATVLALTRFRASVLAEHPGPAKTVTGIQNPDQMARKVAEWLVKECQIAEEYADETRSTGSLPGKPSGATARLMGTVFPPDRKGEWSLPAYRLIKLETDPPGLTGMIVGLTVQDFADGSAVFCRCNCL